MQPKWTTRRAAYYLGEAWGADRGEIVNYDEIETEAIARAMNADPEYLEAVWATWKELLRLAAYTDKQVGEARYWLDVVLIGGLTNP